MSESSVEIAKLRTLYETRGQRIEELAVICEKLEAEAKRLQEKCFDDTMAAKKSGYEEGRAATSERLQCWFAGFFGMEDLAKTPNGWKVDNPRVGWVDAPDWLVQAIQKQESEAAEAEEGK